MRRSALAIVVVAALGVAVAARADDTPSQDPAKAPSSDTTIEPPGHEAGQEPASPSSGTVPASPPSGAVPAPPPSGTVPAPPPHSAVQSVAPDEAEAILGQRVTDADGKDIGRLVDVLVDGNGQPAAAVIDFGGFMGVGNRKIAVHWSVLHFNPGDLKHKVTLEMTPDQIKAAPEFLNPDKAASVVTPAGAAPISP